VYTSIGVVKEDILDGGGKEYIINVLLVNSVNWEGGEDVGVKAN